MDSKKTKVYSTGLANAVCSYINQAEYSVQVAMAYFTHPKICEALLYAIERGLFVECIFDRNKTNYEAYLPEGWDKPRSNTWHLIPQLQRAGIFVYQAGAAGGATSKQMHHKFCILDGKCLLNGSFNWTYKGNIHNNENFLSTEEPETVAEYVQIFNKLREENSSSLEGSAFYVNRFFCDKNDSVTLGEIGSYGELEILENTSTSSQGQSYFSPQQSGVLRVRFAGRAYSFLIQRKHLPSISSRANAQNLAQGELIEMSYQVEHIEELSDLSFFVNGKARALPPSTRLSNGFRFVFKEYLERSSHFELLARNRYGSHKSSHYVRVVQPKMKPAPAIQMGAPTYFRPRLPQVPQLASPHIHIPSPSPAQTRLLPNYKMPVSAPEARKEAQQEKTAPRLQKQLAELRQQPAKPEIPKQPLQKQLTELQQSSAKGLWGILRYKTPFSP